MNSETAARVACSFIAAYYKGFVEDLPSLIEFYGENSFTSFAKFGEAVAVTSQGKAEVRQYLERLNSELGPRKVQIRNADFVPTSDGAIAVTVSGQIFTKLLRQVYSHTFVLSPTKFRENTMFISGDSLRFISEEREKVPANATIVKPGEEVAPVAPAPAATQAAPTAAAEEKKPRVPREKKERPVREKKEKLPEAPAAPSQAAPAPVAAAPVVAPAAPAPAAVADAAPKKERKPREVRERKERPAKEAPAPAAAAPAPASAAPAAAAPVAAPVKPKEAAAPVKEPAAAASAPVAAAAAAPLKREPRGLAQCVRVFGIPTNSLSEAKALGAPYGQVTDAVWKGPKSCDVVLAFSTPKSAAAFVRGDVKVEGVALKRAFYYPFPDEHIKTA